MPRPPVIGPLIFAAGPGGAGARVVGVAGVALVDALGVAECDDDEQPETSVTTAAALTSRDDVRRIRGSLARGVPPFARRDLTARSGALRCTG